MNRKSTQPVLAALLAAKQARLQQRPLAATAAAGVGHNTALNTQNRRVLAQHYRAKYGVK